MTSLPSTYAELAPILGGSDPDALKQLLARPRSLLDVSWFPTHPQPRRVTRGGIHLLLAQAIRNGVPAPQQTMFVEQAGLRRLELVLDDDDRAAVTLYGLMFACGLPAVSEATVLRAGLPGRFCTASHLRLGAQDADQDMPAGRDFGGWLTTVTCFVHDRSAPVAPQRAGVSW